MFEERAIARGKQTLISRRSLKPPNQLAFNAQLYIV